MDFRRPGNALRAIRVQKGWTLERAAATGGVSKAAASRIEGGRLDLCSIDAVDRYARGLGASLDLVVRWRGGDLDRLLNARHSAMHEQMARLWDTFGEWQAVPEVSFSIYGERGVIDWFAWHGRTRTVLVNELKTQLVDIQELVGTNDRRMRLAPVIARERGWDPLTVACWVVVADGRTNRRHLAAHRTLLRTAFPDDGRTVGGWLSNPVGPIRCLSFLPMLQPAKRGLCRVVSAGPRPASILPNLQGAERMAGFEGPGVGQIFTE